MPKIFGVLDAVRPVYDWAYKIIMFICKLLLAADVLITSMSVLGRYVSFIPDPAWSEQMVLTLMVYMAVLSATLAIRKGAHIRMTALDKKLPANLVKALDVLADLAVLALGVILLVEGAKVCNSPLARFGKYESLPGLSRVWMYLPIPVAGAAMVLFELEQLYLHVKLFYVKDDKKEARA